MGFIEKFKEYMDNSIVDEILLLAVIISIIEAIAQNNIKNSNDNSLKFLVGLGFYIIMGYILHYAYHKYELSKINVIWSCISIIFAISLGYLLYDEPFNHWSLLSIFLALTAIMCSFKAGVK